MNFWWDTLALFSPLAALGQALALEAAGQAAAGWWQAAVAAALAVLVALALDWRWGEPPVWLHPVVAMGRLLGAVGRRVAPRVAVERDYGRFWLAALAWCALAALFFVVYGLLQLLLFQGRWWLDGLVLGLLLKPLLAWRMLRDEVGAVEQALQQSLQAGRERLSWLVSRDTAALDAGQVRESAIESLAENLSDSVVAPLLWFVLLGLPGAALYRLANTADAMWGYPGWRGQGEARRHWQWAGKWAARADDGLNWLPARLTAGLLALVARLQGRAVGCAALRQAAATTPSPNGGWPMGAMALALDVRLGKPGVYVLHAGGQVPQAAAVAQALDLAGKVVLALALSALVAMIFGIVYGGI